MALPKIVADLETSLAAKIAVGGTTGTIVSNVDDDGVTLADGEYYFTIDGNNSAKEHIRCTKTGTALTAIYSYSRQGVATSGVAREHRVGAKVIMTDYATYKNYFEAAVITNPGGVSTDNAIVRFDGVTGQLLQNSGVTIDDSNNVTVPGTLSVGTSNAITAGTIELGAASDTTVSRSSAGVIAVEGVVIPSISSTSTLTNKRVTRRLVTTTQSATPAINTDNTDVSNITGLAQAITSFTTNLTGTPVDGDLLEIRITDNGTGRAITWGASFSATTVALPTTTVASTMLRVLFERSASTWACIATA